MNATVPLDAPSVPIAITAPVNNVEPRLKIALLGYRSHPFVGGQGIYLQYLSRALSALGHEVVVYSGQPYPHLDAHIPLIKIPSLDLYEQPSMLRALTWRNVLSYTDMVEWLSKLTGGFAEPYTFGRRIAKALKHSDYDIVHDNQSLGWGLIRLQNQGKTVVSTIHHPIHRDRQLAMESAPDTGYRWLVKRWYSFLSMQEKVVQKLNYAITVSATSQQDIQHFFKRSAKDTPVIYNGIDTSLFKPYPKVKKIPFLLVTTASSDQPLKGLKFVLLALDIVRQQYPNVHLRVVGELKKGGQTAMLLHELQLQDSVSFTQRLTNDELVTTYNQAHAVICPSLYEGFGLPAGEAMACGCAVIATDGGALPEVVGDAGIIVPKANAEKLAQAISNLFDDAQQTQYLQEISRQHIVNNFCWNKVARDLTVYYRKIRSQKTPKEETQSQATCSNSLRENHQPSKLLTHTLKDECCRAHR